MGFVQTGHSTYQLTKAALKAKRSRTTTPISRSASNSPFPSSSLQGSQDDEPTQTRPAFKRSRLENLPPELLQTIFLQAYNIHLCHASKTLYSILASPFLISQVVQNVWEHGSDIEIGRVFRQLFTSNLVNADLITTTLSRITTKRYTQSLFLKSFPFNLFHPPYSTTKSKVLFTAWHFCYTHFYDNKDDYPSTGGETDVLRELKFSHFPDYIQTDLQTAMCQAIRHRRFTTFQLLCSIFPNAFFEPQVIEAMIDLADHETPQSVETAYADFPDLYREREEELRKLGDIETALYETIFFGDDDDKDSRSSINWDMKCTMSRRMMECFYLEGMQVARFPDFEEDIWNKALHRGGDVLRTMLMWETPPVSVVMGSHRAPFYEEYEY